MTEEEKIKNIAKAKARVVAVNDQAWSFIKDEKLRMKEVLKKITAGEDLEKKELLTVTTVFGLLLPIIALEEYESDYEV